MNGLINLIKSINKNDIAFDELGRMIIRLSQPDVDRLKKVKIWQGNVTNKLMHSEDRIVKKSIYLWTCELLNKIQDAIAINDKILLADKTAEIYNNAALILYSIDDIQRARELCYTQIQMFVGCSQISDDERFIKYTYQPWINLCRIDRMQGKVAESFEKLDTLWKIDCDAIANKDNEIYQVVKTCRVLETVKAYLFERRYTELINFVEQNHDKLNQSFLREAHIIALANTGGHAEALKLIKFSKRHYSPVLMNVFLLREYEILREPGLILNIFRYCLNVLKTPTVNNIVFSLNVTDVMRESKLTDESIELVYACLESASQIGDEPLESECLSRLYNLMIDAHDKSCIERLMIKHYSNTQYPSARKKMLNVCPSLSNIKFDDDLEIVDDLFERLMDFSNHILL